MPLSYLDEMRCQNAAASPERNGHIWRVSNMTRTAADYLVEALPPAGVKLHRRFGSVASLLRDRLERMDTWWARNSYWD